MTIGYWLYAAWALALIALATGNFAVILAAIVALAMGLA